MGKLKFKRGDLVVHDVFPELRGVVIQTKHLEIELDEGEFLKVVKLMIELFF